MSTFFLSDLHLDAHQTDLLKALENLLKRFLTQAPQAVYLLGDVFDAWIGDDDPIPWFDPIKTQLQQLVRQDCGLYFLHGNRDFLIGQKFCDQINAQLITEPYIINLYGTPTALLHGDALCTQDTEYQAFKQMVRNPSWQQAFLSKPLTERRGIGHHLRAQSRNQTSNKPEDIMDVDPEAVNALFNELKVTRIIHGHTHRPNLHEHPNQTQRWVLGDWRTQPESSISYLEATADDLTLYAGDQSWAQKLTQRP